MARPRPAASGEIASVDTLASDIANIQAVVEIATLGMPSEMGQSNRASRYTGSPLINTNQARDLMIRTFNMEIEVVNAERRRNGQTPLINMSAMNASDQHPFIAIIGEAIAAAKRGAAFAGQSVAIPAGQAAPAIVAGARVRLRPGTDTNRLGIPAEALAAVGIVEDFDEEDDVTEVGVYYDFNAATYWFNINDLEVVI